MIRKIDRVPDPPREATAQADPSPSVPESSERGPTEAGPTEADPSPAGEPGRTGVEPPAPVSEPGRVPAESPPPAGETGSEPAGEDRADAAGSQAENEGEENEGDDGEEAASTGKRRGRRNPVAPELPLTARVEALLFAVGDPLAPARLSRLLGETTDDVKAALQELVKAWHERPGAIELVQIAGGYRFMTRPEYHPVLQQLVKKGGAERLSPAALETLAIVAYRQPLNRAEIEAVRGVQAGPLLRVLLDRDLIRVTGRSTEPGHPLLYGTTKRFLDHFGLKSLKNLPDLKDVLESR